MNSLLKRQRNARKRAKLRAHRRARALQQRLSIRYEIILRSDRTNFLTVARNHLAEIGSPTSLDALNNWMAWSKKSPSPISHKYIIGEGVIQHDCYKFDHFNTCIPYQLGRYIEHNESGQPCCILRISLNGGASWHTVTTEEGFVSVVKRYMRELQTTMHQA